ncbi:MAG: hypothetical protein JWN70_5617 [Planctomycetaceae bacterium]|nr:hypothetical protein [Planctomycetaceae bacterium]
MARPPVCLGYCLVLIGVCSAHLAGCTPAPPKREYAEVMGTVKYQGKPVSKGSIVFQPESGAPVVAELDAEGNYSLEGVIGPNDVMVRNPLPAAAAHTDDIKANKAAQAEYDKAVKSAKIIPDKYSSTSSGLKFDVQPGTNSADFDLK